MAKGHRNRRGDVATKQAPAAHGRVLAAVEWDALCAELGGGAADMLRVSTLMQPDHFSVRFVELEEDTLVSGIEGYVSKQATDLRVGNVQLVVTRERAALLLRVPPLEEVHWMVLWEGDFSAIHKAMRS